MWTLCAFLRLPVGRLLQVIDLVASVVAVLLLAVGVLRCPRLAAQALAVGTLQVELGDGYQILVIMCRDAFDGKVAASLLLVELDSLPAISGIESAFSHGCGRVEVGLVANVVVFVRLFQLQLVKFWLGPPDFLEQPPAALPGSY